MDLSGAVIAALISLDVVDWTAQQGGLVTAWASALIALIAALAKHFHPGSTKEPVAVVGAVFALIATSISLYAGFSGSINDQQLSAILGVVSSFGSVAAALIARQFVQPSPERLTPPRA